MLPMIMVESYSIPGCKRASAKSSNEKYQETIIPLLGSYSAQHNSLDIANLEPEKALLFSSWLSYHLVRRSGFIVI